MSALVGILSFFGFFVCIVMTIVNAIRKKPVKPVAIGIAVCFVLFSICVAVTPASDDNTEEKKNATVEVEKEAQAKTSDAVPSVADASESETTAVAETSSNADMAVMEYDKLQSLFAELTYRTTEEELLSLIESYGLEYTAQKYNGTPKNLMYKIAYEKGVSAHRYADSGDHLEVTFSQADGSFMYADYTKSCEIALLYNYGTYWDFSFNEPMNEYTGYYYYTAGDSKGGITLLYSNGNSKETGYNRVDSAEEAIYNTLH